MVNGDCTYFGEKKVEVDDVGVQRWLMSDGITLSSALDVCSRVEHQTGSVSFGLKNPKLAKTEKFKSRPVPVRLNLWLGRVTVEMGLD